jgi:signal transduction histidine kinase
MRQRADEVGGDVAVDTGPDGTTVTARLPLHREGHDA